MSNELTITLSGPKHSEQQARNALASARFDVQGSGHDYGLPAAVDGQAEAFVNVIGEDVDKAWDAVRSLGWNLRVHHAKPEPGLPSLSRQIEERFAEYERRIAHLEAWLQRPPMRGASVESPGFANQNSTYGAEQTRRAIASLLQRGSTVGSIAGGVVGVTDCALAAPASGMSVNVAPGEVWVPGSSSSTQGGYYCRVSSTTNLAIAASDPTSPRIDRVSAIVTDSAYAGGTNTFALAVETGTPTAGATLANLSGVASAPTSSYTIGYVLVPATATNIVAADLLGSAAVIQASTGLSVVAQTGNFTATPNTLNVVNNSGGVATCTLPSPAKGARVGVVAIAANLVTVTAGSAIIDTPGTQGVLQTSFSFGVYGASVMLESDGVNWYVTSGQLDTAWESLTLATNIASGGYGASARMQNDVVRLKGTLTNNTGGTYTGTLATVPAGLRPSIALLSLAAVNTTPATQPIQITSAGVISCPESIGSGATVSLDGIAYTTY